MKLSSMGPVRLAKRFASYGFNVIRLKKNVCFSRVVNHAVLPDIFYSPKYYGVNGVINHSTEKLCISPATPAYALPTNAIMPAVTAILGRSHNRSKFWAISFKIVFYRTCYYHILGSPWSWRQLGTTMVIRLTLKRYRSFRRHWKICVANICGIT